MIPDKNRQLAEVLKEVRRIQVHTNRLVTGVLAGGYHSIFRGRGIEFDEVREYEEGDDPRTVDWNVTARVGKPYIKKFVDERNLTVLFLLDLSASMSAGFGDFTGRDAAARFVATLAFSAVRSNDTVGMITFGEKVEKFVRPKKGVGQALRLLRDTLATPPTAGRSDLVAALRMASAVVRRRSIIFVVSDFLADGWKSALTMCARLHDVVAVRISLPEIDDPPRAVTAMVDPETGDRVVADFADPSVRKIYADGVQKWRNASRDAFRRAAVDVVDVRVPKRRRADFVVGPIVGFFRMRAERGEKR